MTPAQFSLYSRLFDAIAALRAAGEHQDLTLMGSVAGAALRTWGAAHRIDVTPETIGDADIGKTWTALRALVPGDFIPSITVHLSDDIPTPGAVVAVDSTAADIEMEIPF